MMNNPEKTKYLVDTNILIGFSLWEPISLQFNNHFWSKFAQALRAGRWILLDVVVNEVIYKNDLKKWCQEQARQGLVKKIDNNDRKRAIEINNAYPVIDQRTGKSRGDTYLLAYAEANNLGISSRESKRVVKEELSQESKSIIEDNLYKIPDVCAELNIKFLRKPEYFLRTIGFN